MERLKKFFRGLLIMIVIVSCSLSINAITITIPQGHEFTAYKIFSGTQSSDGKELADINWGNGVIETNFLNALKKDALFATSSDFVNCSTASDVANVLASKEFSTNMEKANRVANIAYQNRIQENGIALSALPNGNVTLESGYYLIVDTTSQNVEALNPALLKVTDKNLEIAEKISYPKFEKKVFESSYSEPNNIYGNGFNDVADYSINDDIQFHLIGTIPNLEYYDNYHYAFNDNYSNAFMINKESIKVYLSEDQKVDQMDVLLNPADGSYSTSFDDINHAFSVIVGNLKNIIGKFKNNFKFVIVEYSAKLNENAVIGNKGNVNSASLEYSNNPNNKDSRAITPIDEVVVYTYGLTVNKLDGEDKKSPLVAQFQLMNNKGMYACIKGEKLVSWGLKEKASTISSVNGNLSIQGIDEGVYQLIEIKAPNGYNTPKNPFTFTIDALTNNGNNGIKDSNGVVNALSSINVTLDSTTTNGENGQVTITIYNNKGALLPETGGSGTTVIYIAGITLISLGVVLLVLNNRKNKRD